MSEIIQNISDIFSIISLVFSIYCGNFFTTQKNIFFFSEEFLPVRPADMKKALHTMQSKRVQGCMGRADMCLSNAVCLFLYVYQSRLHITVRPAMTIDTMLMSLMRMLRLGPEVSLNGSPTVSPTTVAL